MRDVSPVAPGDDEGILLAQVGNAFCLLAGESHLDAMLSGAAPYPTPVRCLRLAAFETLTALLPEGLGEHALWSIHPAIVERLQRNNELIVVEQPERG